MHLAYPMNLIPLTLFRDACEHLGLFRIKSTKLGSIYGGKKKKVK
jgi:hypothetical protein